MKLIVLFLFLFTAYCTQANELKEGYGSFNVPHESCVQRCKEFRVHRSDEFVFSGNIQEQEHISISGLQDANYVIHFIGDDKKTSTSTHFNVKHYPLFESLIFFALGLSLFCFLIISIQTNRA